jgi:hypothetical protein
MAPDRESSAPAREYRSIVIFRTPRNAGAALHMQMQGAGGATARWLASFLPVETLADIAIAIGIGLALSHVRRALRGDRVGCTGLMRGFVAFVRQLQARIAIAAPRPGNARGVVGGHVRGGDGTVRDSPRSMDPATLHAASAS